MESFNLIILIFILLAGTVLIVANIQRKEQKKAEKFHQASKYKYRANETANILSNFAKIPIGEETRKILLQVIQKNLTLALKIQPEDRYIRERLPVVNKQLTNTASKTDSGQLLVPTDSQQLDKLLNSLKKLSVYIIKISQSNKLDLPLTKSSIAKLSSLITEVKLTTYIHQIKKGLTTKNYDFAVKMLITTKQIMSGLKNKSNRIVTLQDHLTQLEQEVKISFKNAKKENSNQKNAMSYINEEAKENSGFRLKKKW